MGNNPNNIQEVILFPAMKPKVENPGQGGQATGTTAAPTGLGVSRQFSIEKMADIEAYLSECQFLSGQALPGAQDYEILSAMNAKGFVPHNDKLPNTFGWFWNLNSFSEPARELWKGGSAQNQKPASRKGSGKANARNKSGKPSAKNSPKPAPVKKEIAAADDDFDL